MKILLINSLDKRYGSTYRFRKFYEFLKVAPFNPIYIESNCDSSIGFINVKQNDNLCGYLKGTLKRAILTVKLDYDILVIQKFIPITLPCIFIAKLRGKKVVVDWDDIDTALQSNIFRKILTRICEKWGPKFADIITTHSRYIQNIAVNKFKKRAEIINQGVDFSLFDPVKCNKDEISEKYGTKDKIVLGYLCTLTEGGSRDIDVILKSFSHIIKKRKDLILLIVGGGPKEQEIKRMIDDLDISGSVVVTGLLAQQDVPKIINIFDLSLVYMREDEGNRGRVSFKVLESLAMNKPVVGHLFGETLERFGKYVNQVGLDANSFQEEILKSISGIKSAKKFRDEIIKEYSWDNIAREYRKLIKGFFENARK